jgi:tricorn protease
MRLVFVFLTLLLWYLPGLSQNQLALMRFPDIHQDEIVFVHGEDIWKVNANGGVAIRLTIHDGAERFPKFSPDGSLIAFTAEYDGNADVYVMDSFGGNITRVTYHPGYDEVIGWHPVKNKIIFRSGRHSYSRFYKLFLISPTGTDLEEIILHEASFGSFSPDGKKIAYNKVSRENRTWKRYKGGTAQEIYVYDLESNEEKNISQFNGTDRIPMWIGDKIYFSSDRERTLNIYSYDTKTSTITKLTDHSDYDVRRPSEDQHKIVYEIAGTLWTLDVISGESRQVPVEIRTDMEEVRPRWVTPDKMVQGFDCSPGGERALVVARGEIFTVPAEKGPTRNLSTSSGSREKDAVWSPDGKQIAYLSDKSGEYEIWLTDASGMKSPKKITTHKDGFRHSLRWSPDGQKLSFVDQTLRLFYIDIKSGKITEVDKAEYENIDVSIDKKPISDYSWSPDSRFITYSKMDKDHVYKLYIYALENGTKNLISDGIFNDFNPVFTQDGNHLIFVSNRRFDPTYCDFEWEMVYKDVAGLYALTLRKDGPRLFPLESDEPGEKELTGKEKDKNAELRIDFDGLYSRIEPFPLKNGNYRALAVNKSAVYYLNSEDGDYNRFEFRRLKPRKLYAFPLDKRSEEKVMDEVDDFKLSFDGSKIVYRHTHDIGIIDSDKRDVSAKPIDLKNMRMHLDPRAEWRQIYFEAWRMERDFYYEQQMHGLDWKSIREKYARLLPFASCRQDIQYIVGEMIGELNTSHTYVYGGDRFREAEDVSTGLLGVDWQVDTANKRYHFAKIYRVSDWAREIYPPLTGPDMDVREGDYLLRVNSIDVNSDRNIYSYFEDQVNKQVSLVVNNKPSFNGAREIVVKPVHNEGILRYQDWLEHNRLTVEKESDGTIGYIHLPDTYTGSAREFPKYFYSQIRKQGLIIDGRFNGGGLDPYIFLHRLNREILAYWTRRYSHDQTTPFMATNAHMVCITNRQAGSGGDMLPMEFKMLNMGPVIGTRTWGGLVGVSMFIELIDGGGLTAPDYRIYDPNGKWIVENIGVQPDIVVDLSSAEMQRGYDAQLMKAVEVLKNKIKENPITWPQHEPFPVDR